MESSSVENEEDVENMEISDNDDDEIAAASLPASEEEEAPEEVAAEDDGNDKGIQDESDVEVAKLKKLERIKKQRIKEIICGLEKLKNQQIDAQASVNTKRKNQFKYLLQHTELFAHFAKSDQSSCHKTNERGYHSSKMLKEEECGVGNTRLVVQPPFIMEKMKEYQLTGLNWLISRYEKGLNGILADERFRGIKGPHMIVAPKSTIKNWMSKIENACPVLRAVMFLGSSDNKKLESGEFDVCVTSFESATKEKLTFRQFNWRYIIIHQAHQIKTENSVLSQTMRKYKTNYRLLIIDTPLQRIMKR